MKLRMFILILYLSLGQAGEHVHFDNDLKVKNIETPEKLIYIQNEFNLTAFEQTKNAMNFTGKVILVTGSNSGIGAEAVRLFSYLGAQVIVTGRNVSRIKQVGYECCKLSPYGLKPLEVAADLTVYEELYNLFEQTISAFNRLDILVNNAGIEQVGRIIDRNYSRVYRDVTAIDETAVLQLTQLFIPYLNQTNGTIINVDSFILDTPSPDYEAYGMSKSALVYETQALAIELGPRIRVNSIRPGFILNTRIQRYEIPNQMFIDLRARGASLGRNGQPIDIARGMAFIASPLAQFFDGQVLRLDGGYFSR